MANFCMWNTPTLDEQLCTLRFELKLQLAVADLEIWWEGQKVAFNDHIFFT